MSTCYYHSVAEQSIVSPPFLSISVEIAKAWAWAFRRATRAGSAPQVNIPMVELHELNEGFFTGKSAINDDNGGGSKPITSNFSEKNIYLPAILRFHVWVEVRVPECPFLVFGDVVGDESTLYKPKNCGESSNWGSHHIHWVIGICHVMGICQLLKHGDLSAVKQC